jgi:phage tail tape-measure protein
MTNRTVLTPTTLTANSAIVSTANDGTGFTAADNTNGMSIAIPTTAIPASGNIDRMILLVLNTNGTGRTVTVRGATSDGGLTKTGAGTGNGAAFTYPGFEGGKGDLVTSAMTLTTGIGIIGPFEVARFLQPDGTVSVDFSGATGFIKALILPRSF